jgi:predicted transposase/invertase (TIGR01784 family)
MAVSHLCEVYMNNIEKCLFPLDADILPPADDRIFKVLLTHPDAKQVLIDIISTVIEQKVVDAQIRNIELPVMDIDEKNERFDVNCTIDTGDQVDVEMHSSKIVEVGDNRKNFINKYVYYLTDLHSSQKSRGLMYHKLVRTYQVTFCTNPVFPKLPGFVTRFSLRTNDGFQLSDQINLVIVELDKLSAITCKPVNEMTSFEKWSVFLKYAQEPLRREMINSIIKEKEEIGMAATLLQEISKDERERAIQRSRRMYETDMTSNRLTSELIGELRANEKWEAIVAGKDKELANNKAVLADKDAELVDKNAEIELLRSQIAELQAGK